VRRHGPWRTLGLDPTEDRGAIRRAYASKLRQIDPDRDVEGYTRLRNARDHALALAQSTVPGEVREPVTADERRDEWPDEPRPDEAAEELEGSASSRPLGDEPEQPLAPQILLGILFPAGQTSEEPLDRDELMAAEQALAAILGQAETSSIDEQAGIENWLAHHLASSWPRSAWLVEQAALAFGWMEESGQLGERPAVHFLNQRLKGMGFVAKVQQPGHTLHKAWTELAKPGPKGTFAFMRARRDDVRLLLDGIRERYPEVEGHLDPERVASWEGSQEAEPGSAWLTFVILASAAGLLRLCAASFDSTPPPPIDVDVGSQQLDGLVTELFGERVPDATLLAEVPALAPAIKGLVSGAAYLRPNARDVMIQQIRALTLLAAREANFEQLVAIKQLKLDLLRAAREQGGSSECLDFSRDILFPADLDVGEELRSRERALALELLRAGRLREGLAEFPSRAAIPGHVIQAMMQSTGFSRQVIDEASQKIGSEPILCAYEIALLEAVLANPGKVSADLLRIV
jgi:hypothetical protein